MNIYAMNYKGKIHNDKMKNLFYGGAFLHGKLEQVNGYDLFAIKTKHYDELLEKGNGIQKVTVIMCDGTKIDADFYFWSVWQGKHLKGLVVLPDDTDSVAYALDMLEEKPDFI